MAGDTFRVLVVCTGNVCRSPLAERLIRARLRAALGEGADRFEVTSAGTRALVGSPMDERAAAGARTLDADPEGFAARELTAEQVAAADLVLAAARAHRAAAVELHPAANRYAFTIREFGRIAGKLPAGAVDPNAEPVVRAAELVAAVALRRGSVWPERPEDDDVPDPVGAGDEVFRNVAAVVADALAAPLRLVTGVDVAQVGGAAPVGRAWTLRRTARHAGAVLVGLSVLACGWLAVRGVQAEHALNRVRTDLHTVRGALLTGDGRAVQRAVADARHQAERAERLTADPVWRLAALPPHLGNTARAVRAVSAAVGDLSDRVLPAVADVATDLAPRRLRPSGDRLDVAGIARTAPALDVAAAGVARAEARLGGLDLGWSPPAVVSGVHRLRRDLDRAASALAGLRRGVRLAPPMLGADGPRRYFVAFQNNAEARGTGGLVGMYAVVTADHGRLRVERLGSNTDLVDAPRVPVDLGQGFQQRWGDDPAMWANSNLDPSFPDTARLWLALWQRQTGQRLDGAIATDPVALSYTLAATGPVRLPAGGSLDAANAVWFTMSGVYARYPGSDPVRNAFMRSVAGAVLDTLLSGRGDPRRLAGALGRATAERRLMVYSGHPDEERDLAATPLGGRLPDGAGPYAYVVVNNAAGSKMDYYLDRRVSYRSSECGDGVRQSRIEITFGNAAPPADRLPAYVTQRLDRGSTLEQSPARGALSELVSVYGPRGSGVRHATVDGRELQISVSAEDGRPVWGFPLVVDPGSRRTVVLDVTEPASNAAPVVPAQPLARPQRTEVDVEPCR